MLLGIAAGCKKTEQTAQQPAATEAPTAEPTAAPTEVPAPTEPPFKGAYPGDDYESGAVGENGAAACANQIASQIGVDILKAGGNAVDAAVAMIYAVGLLEPAASGMGGAGQMVIYLKEENRYLVLEYMTQAPGAAIAGEISTDTSSYPPSVESIAIPGVVHGTMTALEKYGTMTPRQVLQPVIDLARNGFKLPERWNSNIEGRYDNLSSYPYTLNLYTDDGFTYPAGATIKNTDLADTLELIADGGKEAFYNSDFTQKMVDYIQSIGGLLTREDFAQYETRERDAISTTYRGKTVYTVNGPSNGGVALLEMLNIMENFDMAGLGRDSMEAVKITADAYALAYMDGTAYMADPEYYDLPVEEMISKEYAAERAKKITLDTYLKNAKKGSLTVTLNATGEKVNADNTPDQGGTTHLAVMDKYGNVVSTTNTNGINFGSAVAVPGTGFVFSAHLGNLNNSASAKVNKLMPYIRVRSTICPSIVADENGVPFLAVGSPGNWALVSAVAIAISNVIDRYNLTDNYVMDGSLPTFTAVPPQFAANNETGEDFSADQDQFLDLCDYNPDAAQAFFEAAKKELGKDEFTFTIIYGSNEGNEVALVAQAIKEDIEAELDGVTINLQPMTKAERLDKMQNDNYDIALTRWGPDYADPMTYLGMWVTKLRLLEQRRV